MLTLAPPQSRQSSPQVFPGFDGGGPGSWLHESAQMPSDVAALALAVAVTVTETLVHDTFLLPNMVQHRDALLALPAASAGRLVYRGSPQVVLRSRARRVMELAVLVNRDDAGQVRANPPAGAVEVARCGDATRRCVPIRARVANTMDMLKIVVDDARVELMRHRVLLGQLVPNWAVRPETVDVKRLGCGRGQPHYQHAAYPHHRARPLPGRLMMLMPLTTPAPFIYQRCETK